MSLIIHDGSCKCILIKLINSSITGCKITKNKIIQRNNSPKNDIFQRNNSLKTDFFQRNNFFEDINNRNLNDTIKRFVHP